MNTDATQTHSSPSPPLSFRSAPRVGPSHGRLDRDCSWKLHWAPVAAPPPGLAESGQASHVCSVARRLRSPWAAQHIVVYGTALSDCSARCAWGLGARALGTNIGAAVGARRALPGASSRVCTNVSADDCAESSVTSTLDKLFGQSDCSRYVVDLDSPPEQRWAHVVRDFSELLPDVVSLADEILGDLGVKIAEPILSTAAKAGFVQYGDELRGISAATGVSLGKVVILVLTKHLQHARPLW